MADLMSRLRVNVFTWGMEEPTIDAMVELAQLAEELGYEAIHVPWHYTLPTTGSFRDFGTRYLVDPTVLMPVLARETRRVKLALEFVLGTLHPFAWAQYLASLDVASGGRILAVPVLGWWPDDFKAGASRREQRGARMDEALAAATSLWAGEPVDQPGRFWDCTGLALNPRPLQQPLPVWIGGGDKSIDRASRFATAIYPLVPTADELRQQWRPWLDDAARRHGRRLELAAVNCPLVTDDQAWLEAHAYPRMVARINGLPLADAQRRLHDVSLWRPEDRLIIGPPRACAERLSQLFNAGTDHFVLDLYMHGWEPVSFGREQMTRFAREVVPLAEPLVNLTRT